MAPKSNAMTRSLTVEVDGERYSGTYTVESGTVRVNYGGRTNGPTQAGASAEMTARMLFRELLARDKSRGSGRSE